MTKYDYYDEAKKVHIFQYLFEKSKKRDNGYFVNKEARLKKSAEEAKGLAKKKKGVEASNNKSWQAAGRR